MDLTLEDKILLIIIAIAVFLFLFGCTKTVYVDVPGNCTIENVTNITYTTYTYNVTNVTYVENNTYVYNSSVKKYSATCGDIPPDFDFLTKYPCYWETRTKYGFGKYYDVATGCVSLGLPDACACYWSIPEFVGARFSTGFGVIG